VRGPSRTVGIGLDPLGEGSVIDGSHAKSRARLDPDDHIGDSYALEMYLLD
jgi:hypothetical protein